MKSKLGARNWFAVCRAATLCVCTWMVQTSGATAAQTNDFSQIAKQLPAQVSGQIVRSDTHEPVPKAEVSLYPQDESTSRAAGGNRIVRTGADGRFLFSDLPPGSYALSVWRSGYADFSCAKSRGCGQLSLKSGQKVEGIVLRLDPAGVIAGHVSTRTRIQWKAFKFMRCASISCRAVDGRSTA